MKNGYISMLKNKGIFNHYLIYLDKTILDSKTSSDVLKSAENH